MKNSSILALLIVLISCSTEGVKIDKLDSLSESDTIAVDSSGSIDDEALLALEKELPNGVRVVWEKKNDSTRLKFGDVVKLDFVGRTSEGKIFDSSKKIERFIPARVGWGMLLKGWDVGLQELGLNEKAKIFIPSSMAYGKKGNGREVGPNTDLIVDVEVKEKLSPIFDSSGIKVYIVERFLEKKNPKSVNQSKKIMFDYWSFTDEGKRYDSSYEKGHSFVYHVGDKNLNFGLRKGLEQLKEGESAYIHVPAKHGFGKKGLKGMVKANQDLMFIVTIKKAE